MVVKLTFKEWPADEDRMASATVYSKGTYIGRLYRWEEPTGNVWRFTASVRTYEDEELLAVLEELKQRNLEENAQSLLERTEDVT